MTLTHDKENISTKVVDEGQFLQKEVHKGKVQTDVVNKGNSFTSFTKGISLFSSDFYQVFD